MRKMVVLLCLGLAVAGCGDRFKIGKRGDTFDGQVFRGAAKSDRKDLQSFVATVRPVSASFDGAVQAAVHQGVKHCIEYYGTSDIDWTVGPDTPREALVIDNDSLTFTGTCRDF
jgi:hypothetical protein